MLESRWILDPMEEMGLAALALTIEMGAYNPKVSFLHSILLLNEIINFVLFIGDCVCRFTVVEVPIFTSITT